MHRAGTSLTARILQRAGADLGPPAGFIAPDNWNPDGYFEQRDILELNRLLLHGTWGKLALVLPPSAARVRQRGRRVGERLAAVDGEYRGRLVKAPRFCITAPAWLEHGTKFEQIIICLREPHEVADSLRRRNKLPVPLGLRIWRQHYEANLRLVQDLPHRWVSYAHMLRRETSVQEVAGMARFLGLPFDEKRDAEWVSGIIRTRQDDRTELWHGYPAKLAQMWKELRERHARQPNQ